MKLGRVIGRVTLSRSVPALEGGRWLIVSPMDRETIPSWDGDDTRMSSASTPVVYDDIGGWMGDIIGYSEGREAAMPFNEPTPVDAYSCALIDQIDYRDR